MSVNDRVPDEVQRSVVTITECRRPTPALRLLGTEVVKCLETLMECHTLMATARPMPCL
jgi:hypothetical protein